jgi:hypothetical protein
MRVQTVCFEFISDGCSLVQFWGAEKSPRLCYVPLAAVWIEAVDRSRIRYFQCLSHLCLVFIRCCSLLLDFSSTAARCSGDFSSTFAAPLSLASFIPCAPSLSRRPPLFSPSSARPPSHLYLLPCALQPNQACPCSQFFRTESPSARALCSIVSGSSFSLRPAEVLGAPPPLFPPALRAPALCRASLCSSSPCCARRRPASSPSRPGQAPARISLPSARSLPLAAPAASPWCRARAFLDPVWSSPRHGALLLCSFLPVLARWIFFLSHGGRAPLPQSIFPAHGLSQLLRVFLCSPSRRASLRTRASSLQRPSLARLFTGGDGRARPVFGRAQPKFSPCSASTTVPRARVFHYSLPVLHFEFERGHFLLHRLIGSAVVCLCTLADPW